MISHRQVGQTGIPWIAVVLAICTGGMCAQTTSVAAAQVTDEWNTVYHFKSACPLAIDLDRIAILETEVIGWRTAALQASGFQPSRETVPIVGWTLLDLPTGRRSKAGLEGTVPALADNDLADFVSPVFFDDLGGPLIVTPDIFVGFHKDVPRAMAQAIINTITPAEITASDYRGFRGVYRLRSTSRSGIDVLRTAAALARRPEVRFAEPDFIFTGHQTLVPNDPDFPDQWGLHNTGQSTECGPAGAPDIDIDATEAWDLGLGTPNVRVVIIDSGYELTHPDLNHSGFGADFTGEGGNGSPVWPCDRHGTAVAGCVSAIINNGSGGCGVAPGCTVASARPFIPTETSSPCSGQWTSQSSWTADSLAWAMNTVQARVTNNSNAYGFQSALIETAYADTRDAGLVHFASAGNGAMGTIGYPAGIDSVNAIGAIDQNGGLAPFSNYGPGLAFVAPGVDILTTDRVGTDGYTPGDTACVNGTSFSSPYAAGVAALVFSKNASLTSDEVETIMQSNSVDLGIAGYDETFGWGLVNAHAAVLPDSDGVHMVPTEFATIQAAINAAVAGNEVVVAPGEYFEHINLLGKAITVRSTDPTDPVVVAATIINGDGTGTVVTCTSGEGPDTVLSGFTITGGYASNGGGMHNSYSSPTVRNCAFTGNVASIRGGGMYNLYSGPAVLDCIFANNSSDAHGGGGIFNDNPPPPGPIVTVVNCSFTGNTAGFGAAMVNSGASPIVINCLFKDNAASDTGGGIWSATQSNPEVTNCLFIGNAATDGAAMANYSSSNPTVTNCTFSGNTASIDGGAVSNNSSSPTLSNCILWGNSPAQISASGSPTVMFCNIEGGWPGSGNIDADPLFVAPAIDNLRLLVGSPCIDAGDDRLLPLDSADLDGDGNTSEPLPLDLDGALRISDGFVDMGAFEFVDPCGPCAADFDDDGEVGFRDLVLLLANWASTCDPGDCIGDVDCDGDVDFADLLALLAAWGPCPDP